MLFTQSIIISSAILLPGFIFYAHLFRLNENVATVTSQSNRIFSTVIIGIGAILSHMVGCVLLYVISLISKRTDCSITKINPDFYRLLSSETKLSFDIVFVLLVSLVLLSFIALSLSWVLSKIEFSRDLILKNKSGVFYDLFQKTENVDSILMVYVLTKSSRSTSKYTQNLGYSGILENLVHDGQEVQAVHLLKATPFYSKLTADNFEVEQVKKGSDNLLESLIIHRPEISNIAFRILKINN